MAKFKTDAITTTDLKEYLLESDDFQFELEIFRLCRIHGMDAYHGGMYRDPVTKKDRQYDVRAAKYNNQCIIKLAVECKNLKPYHPLLISRVPRLLSESFHEIIISKPVQPNEFAPAVRYTDTNSVFPENGMVGKSTAQVGRLENKGELTGGDADAYEKWSQAHASSHDLVVESNRHWENFKNMSIAVYIQPILVVSDGTLWVADYDAEGNSVAEPIQVDECSLYLGKLIEPDIITARCTLSHLLVFTKSGFTKLLGKISVNTHYWRSIFNQFY